MGTFHSRTRCGSGALSLPWERQEAGYRAALSLLLSYETVMRRSQGYFRVLGDGSGYSVAPGDRVFFALAYEN